MSSTQTDTYVTGWNAAGRRRPWRWLSTLGMVLLSFFSKISDSSPAGEESASSEDRAKPCNKPGGDCTMVQCCCLACADVQCPYDEHPKDFTCPPGSHKTYWMCLQGTQLIGCGECAATDDCNYGPWFCSIEFVLGTTRFSS